MKVRWPSEVQDPIRQHGSARQAIRSAFRDPRSLIMVLDLVAVY